MRGCEDMHGFDSTTLRTLKGEGHKYCSIDPLTIAILAGSAVQGVGQYLGGQQQAGALTAAQQAQSREARKARQLAQQQFALQRQLLMEGAPLRDILQQGGMEAAGLLREDILREPGESPFFQRALERGSAATAAQLGGFGLSPRSRAFGTAIGELGAGLTAQEIEAIRNQRMQLAQLGQQSSVAGLAPAFGAQGVGLAGQAAGLAGQAAGLGVQAGGVRGAGTAAALGTLGALPMQYAQLQLLSNLSKFGSTNNNAGLPKPIGAGIEPTLPRGFGLGGY